MVNYIIKRLFEQSRPSNADYLSTMCKPSYAICVVTLCYFPSFLTWAPSIRSSPDTICVPQCVKIACGIFLMKFTYCLMPSSLFYLFTKLINLSCTNTMSIGEESSSHLSTIFCASGIRS